MAETNEPQRDQGERGEVRRPDPDAARQDPENLELRRQVQDDRDALQEQRDRVEATTPPEAKEQTIGEMTEEIERRTSE